ncbi:hypothetical protein FRC02_000922 [Tulasnella sp. 418]|nr:hypothetical protein FRC02_000922 [Tulasnella sp. 418]
MPPRLSTPSFRPLSAIFIGDLPDNLTQSPRQLPSPPSTNSQGSGDSGSSRSKSRTALMDEPRSRPQSRISIQEYPKPRNTSSSEEEDNDGDHTARLLSDSRVNSSISSSSVASLSRASSRAHTRFDENPPSGRASSIAARNRQVLDRMSTALSSSRLNTPTSRTTQRSPIPPRPPHLETSSSRQIITRQHELEGSETEREKAAYSSDELSTPPSSSLVPTFDERNNQVDLDSRSASRSQGRTYITGLNGTSTRRRPPAFGDLSGESGQHSIFTDAVAAAVQSTPAPTRKSPHRIRNPLPREFRGESQEGDSHAREPSFTSETSHSSQYTSTRQLHSYESSSQHRSPSRNYSRPISRISSAVNTGRRSPDHSAMETDTYGKSRPAFRSQTLRERRPPLDEHFGPESTQPPEDRRNQDRPPTTKPWRYQNRGGSAESALAGHTRVRSLVGAELRAAGLTQDISWSPTKRREERREREYPDANSSKHDGPSGNSSSSAISEGSNDPRALEMRRDRLSRGGLGVKGNDNNGDRGNDLRYDPKTPVATNSRYSISAMSRANDYSAPISRPSTSAQVYESQPPRTAPPQIRNYRSSYSIPERVAELQASQSTVTGGHSSPIGAIRDRDRNLPTPLGEGSSPMSEHAKLMQDALRSFESNLGRLPKSSANNVQDCISSAHTIVRAAEILNGLLRSSANRALEEQIEAEVGDEVQSEEVSDIWKRVGLELRDGLKVSDEIVRTMTALLLDIGKVVRDATSLSGGSGYASPAPTGSASNYSGGVRPVGRDRDNLHLRAVSLDGEALARSGRGSAGGSGGGSVVSRGSEERRSSRRSIEGPSPLPSSSGRRSIEGYSGGRRSVEGRRSIEGYSNGRRSVEGYAEVEGRGTSNVSRDYISPNRTGKEMYSDHEASFEEGPSSRRVSSRLSNAYDMQRATPNLERSRPLTSPSTVAGEGNTSIIYDKAFTLDSQPTGIPLDNYTFAVPQQLYRF